jgi:Protein of unknown function (DUF2949)
MESRELVQFLQFLQHDLAIPKMSLLPLQPPERTPTLLPMWQYGLVTLAQVNQMVDWLEHRIPG